MLNFKNVMSNDMFLGSWRIFGSGNNLYADNKPYGILPTRITNQSITGTNQEVIGVTIDKTSGDLTVKRHGIADEVSDNLKHFVSTNAITFDSNVVSVTDTTVTVVNEGEYLTWSGGKWKGGSPTTHNIKLENLQDVTKTVGTITQMTMLVGSSNGEFIIKNPEYRDPRANGSGVLSFNADAHKYELYTDIVTDVSLQGQSLDLNKIDGSTESIGDILNLISSGVGQGNFATDNSYLVWQDVANAWVSEEKVTDLTHTDNQTSTNLITASGVYESLVKKQELITNTVDLQCSGIDCSGIYVHDRIECDVLRASDIESNDFNLGSGIINELSVVTKMNTLSIGNLTVDALNYNPEITTTFTVTGGSGMLTVNGSGHNKSVLYTECLVDPAVGYTIDKINLKDVPIRTTVELLLRTDSSSTTMTLSKNVIAVKDDVTYSSTRISFQNDVVFNNTSEILLKIIYLRNDSGTGSPIYYISYEEYDNLP